VRRHPFDPVSLVFGLAFAAAAVIVLAGGELVDDGQFLLPATLLGLGVALLVQNARRPRPADDPNDDPIGHDDLSHDSLDGPGYGAHDPQRDDAGTGTDDIDWSSFAPDEPPGRGTVDWPGT
jgi:hypothetical protein